MGPKGVAQEVRRQQLSLARLVGNSDESFSYIEDKGLALDRQYPFRGTAGQCRDGSVQPAVKLIKWTDEPIR